MKGKDQTRVVDTQAYENWCCHGFARILPVPRQPNVRLVLVVVVVVVLAAGGGYMYRADGLMLGCLARSASG